MEQGSPIGFYSYSAARNYADGEHSGAVQRASSEVDSVANNGKMAVAAVIEEYEFLPES